jgi:TonB-dependent SusC/RagA subfamily outer membrane receptor
VIKDASAAAIYGARAAYGVILVTTKTGTEQGGRAKVRYSGRWGWEEPTVSTDFENRGYWSVYTVDKFWATDAGKNYTTYNAHDMAELLARVNDKTENPDRPWVVQEMRNGRNQWIYYANTDWYHELYNDKHPVQQHNISVTGGNKDIKYFLSGAYDRQSGIIKMNPDVFQKFNLRAKIDARLNKYMRLSNNTSFYSSGYNYPGGSSIRFERLVEGIQAYEKIRLLRPSLNLKGAKDLDEMLRYFASNKYKDETDAPGLLKQMNDLLWKLSR